MVCGAGFMRKPLLYQHMQAQGHLNDTIVVNQPRLTTDDDQIITVINLKIFLRFRFCNKVVFFNDFR